MISPAHEAARADGIVIVGAGQAGGRAAEALRGEGFDGPLTLIGDESEYPYERPSLSKEMLLDPDRETIAWVQTADYYVSQRIQLHLGVGAAGIDRVRRRVLLSDGKEIGYGALILATGSSPRAIEVPGADACHYLRTLDDSRRLCRRLCPGSRLLVIGAGFIGLEVAAAAVQRGAAVIVTDVAPAPLGRVAPAAVSSFYATLHQDRGVVFRPGTAITAIERHGTGLMAITAAAEAIPADTIVVGIGAIPNAELAAAAGIEVERGVVVNEFAMTADPHIFAAGDIAYAYNPRLGRHVMLESWQNAQNQAIAIARNIARDRDREPTPYADIPWFWSDQYGVNLQIAGLAVAGGTGVTRGTPGAERWMHFQFHGDRLVCAVGVNAPRELRAARELITLGSVIDPAELADPDTNLIDLVRRAKREATALRETSPTTF